MKKLNIQYDKELLNYFYTCKESTAFGLGLGLGKTSTMIKYLHEQSNHHPHKKILIVENNTDNLDDIFKKLGSDSIHTWHSKLRTKDNKKIPFESILDTPRLAITKSKFFNLLIQDQATFLHDYDEYIWDEFSGLSPLTVSELIYDFTTITSQLRTVKHTKYVLELSTFFHELIKYFEEICVKKHIVYQAQILQSQRIKAEALLQQYFEYKKHHTLEHSIQLENSIIIILRAIISDKLWMNQYSIDGTSLKYSVGVKDDTIKDFLHEKKMFVLDATAYFNKTMYEYLGINTISQFKRNVIDFNDITMHVHHVDKDINAHNIRKGNEKTLAELYETIDSHDIHTFVPKNAYDTFLTKFGYDQEKLYYFFSGKDIGSNDLRDITEMNIIASQTYPRIMRILYNHLIYNMTLEQAQQPKNDKAEICLMSSHLSQLIGRSNHREHKNNPIHIHTYAVDPNLVYYIKDNFFIGAKIVEHNKPQQIKGKHRFNIVMQTIENKISTRKSYPLYLKNIFTQYFKDNQEMAKFCRNHKQKLIGLGIKYNLQYIKPRGKYPHFQEIL